MKQQGTISTLQLLHRAMLLGVLLFAVIAFWLIYTNRFTPSLAAHDHVLQLIAIAVSFAAVFIGSSVFKKRIFEMRDGQQSMAEKKGGYRAVCILQWALLEGAAFFCIICFLLTGNLAFLALSAAVMLWFVLTGASKTKVMLLLRLSESEMENF